MNANIGEAVLENIKISVVTPVYKAEACLDTLYAQLVSVLARISPDYEIIMVNDRSPDASWDIIKKISSANPRVKGINLSRNFGQYQAIRAGIRHTSGEYVVVMDCDLQDPPEKIADLYEELQKGYDGVFMSRLKRNDSVLRKLTNRMFYMALNFLTGFKFDPSLSNFSVCRRNIINAFLQFREETFFYPMIPLLLGFNITKMPIARDRRLDNEGSGYSLIKLLQLGFDIIISHSSRPLRLMTYGGIVITFICALTMLLFVFLYLHGKIPVSGWTSLSLLIMFSLGIIVTCLGILGTYIAKIYDEVKSRPFYIISETTFQIKNEDMRF